MKSTIETLKENLRKKSRENREFEIRIRQEVTKEMAQQLVKIQEEGDERVIEAQVSRNSARLNDPMNDWTVCDCISLKSNTSDLSQNTAEEMMEKRIELLQEGYAAQNDRRAHRRRREEEVETGKLTTSMKQRLEEQQHRVEALKTENSKLQFNLSTANTEIKQLKAQLSDGSGKEGELAAEIKRVKAQLKEVIYKTRTFSYPQLKEVFYKTRTFSYPHFCAFGVL